MRTKRKQAGEVVIDASDAALRKRHELRRRVKAARNFPLNTCGASRHVQMIAEDLLRFGEHKLLCEEPEHCADSMLAVVAALYEARTELAKLKREAT